LLISETDCIGCTSFVLQIIYLFYSILATILLSSFKEKIDNRTETIEQTRIDILRETDRIYSRSEFIYTNIQLRCAELLNIYRVCTKIWSASRVKKDFVFNLKIELESEKSEKSINLFARNYWKIFIKNIIVSTIQLIILPNSKKIRNTERNFIQKLKNLKKIIKCNSILRNTRTDIIALLYLESWHFFKQLNRFFRSLKMYFVLS